MKDLSRREALNSIGKGGVAALGAVAVAAPALAASGQDIETLFQEWQRARTIVLKMFLQLNVAYDGCLKIPVGPARTRGFDKVNAKVPAAEKADKQVQGLEVRICRMTPANQRESDISDEVLGEMVRRTGSPMSYNLNVLVRRYGGTANALAYYRTTGEV